MKLKFIIIFYYLLYDTAFGDDLKPLVSTPNMKECENDLDCQPPNKPSWPNAVCKKTGKCACQSNSIRRASDSLGWVCISLFDAVTGMLGPPLSCPLPDGAGFRVIHKDLENKAVFCKTSAKAIADGFVTDPACPSGYECIKSIGTFSDQWNGVCCPATSRKFNKIRVMFSHNMRIISNN